MKKILCLIMSALLLMLFAGSALAGVSASYSDGKVTVTTDESGFWEITIDSDWVGYWVGHARPSNTFTMPLEDGEHTVSIFNPDSGRRTASTFWVGEQSADAPTAVPGGEEPAGKPTAVPAKAPVSAPTAAPAPKGPIKADGVSYGKGVMKVQVSGLRGYAEVWLDGKNTGLTVTGNGEASLLRLLEQGTHTLALYAPAYDELSEQRFFAAEFAPDTEAVRPVLENLMKNEAGEKVGVGLAIDRDEESYLLRVSVDNQPGALLTLTKKQLALLLSEGLNVIEYRNGAAALRIDLTKITDEWFSAEEPITAYTFALTVQNDGAAQVAVNAKTENETVDAARMEGITLVRGSRREPVEQNGVY